MQILDEIGDSVVEIVFEHPDVVVVLPIHLEPHHDLRVGHPVDLAPRHGQWGAEVAADALVRWLLHVEAIEDLAEAGEHTRRGIADGPV